jgi:hypothetical protein
MSAEFPKYLMRIDNQKRFLSFGDAVLAHNSNMSDVEIGEYVLLSDYTVRPITAEDRGAISKASDDISASK